jgi:Flp pilus assembly protein TadG
MKPSIFHLMQVHKRASQRGQAALSLAVMIPALILLVGLVADTGSYLIVRRRAQIAVDSAALGAASVLDEAQFATTNDVVIQQALAQAEAARLARVNYKGFAVACQINGARVVCSGSRAVPLQFMKLVGINSLTVTVRATAELKHGITDEGQ